MTYRPSKDFRGSYIFLNFLLYAGLWITLVLIMQLVMQIGFSFVVLIYCGILCLLFLYKIWPAFKTVELETDSITLKNLKITPSQIDKIDHFVTSFDSIDIFIFYFKGKRFLIENNEKVFDKLEPFIKQTEKCKKEYFETHTNLLLNISHTLEYFIIFLTCSMCSYFVFKTLQNSDGINTDYTGLLCITALLALFPLLCFLQSKQCTFDKDNLYISNTKIPFSEITKLKSNVETHEYTYHGRKHINKIFTLLAESKDQTYKIPLWCGTYDYLVEQYLIKKIQ